MPQVGFCVGKKQKRAFFNETQSFMLPEMFCDVSLLLWKQRRRRGCPGSSGPSLPVPHTQPRAVVAGLARREHSPAGDHFCPVEEKTGLLVMPTRSWTPCKKPAHCTAARDIPSVPHGSGSSGCAHTKPALAHVTCVCQQLTAACDTTYVCQVFAACLCDSHRLLIFQGSLQLLTSTPDLFFPPSLSPRKPKSKTNLMVYR